jgi:voltage-gated potassium channel
VSTTLEVPVVAAAPAAPTALDPAWGEAAGSSRTERYDAWNTRVERPLLVAALLFVAVLSLPVLVTSLPGPARLSLRVANVLIWLLFTADYLVRLYLVQDRRRFVKTHIVDLVVVVVPFFRPLRLVRLVAVAGKLGRHGRGGLVGDVTKMVTLAACFSAFLGAVLALDAERHAPETTIANFPDALWWALGTMTAVPYGDVYPVTQTGRLVSATLMILGLVFVGVITAAIAAWFVQFVSREDELEEALEGEGRELKAVHERLAAMETMLQELVAAQAPAPRRTTKSTASRTRAARVE